MIFCLWQSSRVSKKVFSRSELSVLTVVLAKTLAENMLTMLHLARTFQDLVARLDGPLHFRFIFQPLMAAIFAIRDGRRDARAGRQPFRLITEPAKRREVLLTSWKSVGKVFVIALILDAIYQFKVLHWFYPGQALFVALFLAMVPYFLLRGPVNWLTRQSKTDGTKRVFRSPGA